MKSPSGDLGAKKKATTSDSLVSPLYNLVEYSGLKCRHIHLFWFFKVMVQISTPSIGESLYDFGKNLHDSQVCANSPPTPLEPSGIQKRNLFFTRRRRLRLSKEQTTSAEDRGAGKCTILGVPKGFRFWYYVGCWRWFDYAHHGGTPTTTKESHQNHLPHIPLSFNFKPNHIHSGRTPRQINAIFNLFKRDISSIH